jgi:hypothetical protein
LKRKEKEKIRGLKRYWKKEKKPQNIAKICMGENTTFKYETIEMEVELAHRGGMLGAHEEFDVVVVEVSI